MKKGLESGGEEIVVGGKAGDAQAERAIGGVRAFELDGEKVVGQGGGAALGGELGRGVEGEGGQGLAEELAAVRAGFFLAEAAETGHALVEERGGDGRLAMEGLGRGSGTGREGEEVEIAEGKLTEQGEGLVEFAVGFAGEADENVGAEGEGGPGGLEQSLDLGPVVPGAVAAVHTAEQGVGAGLEGQMGVAGQARAAEVGQKGDQSGIPVHGLDGAEAEQGQGGLVEDATEQGGQRGARREIAAPAAEIDAGEDELMASGGDKPLDLPEDGLGGEAARGAAGEGDDAEGAAVRTTLLNLQVGPGLLTGGDLGLFEKGVGETVVDHYHLRWGRILAGLLGGLWGGEDLDELGGVEGLAVGVEEIFDQLGGQGLVAVAENGGDAGERGQFLRGALGVAAGDDDAGQGVAAMGAADEGARGAVGLGGDAAGVDKNELGAVGDLKRMARGAEARGNGFAIGSGGAATEVLNVKISHRFQCSSEKWKVQHMECGWEQK